MSQLSKYVCLDREDITKYLNEDQKNHLETICCKINQGRLSENKDIFTSLVIPDDKPNLYQKVCEELEQMILSGLNDLPLEPMTANMEIIKTDLAKAIEDTADINFSPTKGTVNSQGFDLKACIPDPIAIPPMEAVLIPCGFKLHIGSTGNPNLAAALLPRSGQGAKEGIVLGNLVGLIDNDYQEEWMVSVWNRNRYTSIEINPGQRIAQAIFINCPTNLNFSEVESFTQGTQRQGGFGHTGKA